MEAEDGKTVSLSSQAILAPFTINGNGHLQTLKVEIAGLNDDLLN